MGQVGVGGQGEMFGFSLFVPLILIVLHMDSFRT